MESECPDPFPHLRMLPDDFELEVCRCCGGFVKYIGYYHRGGMRVGPLALSFQYVEALGRINMYEEAAFLMTEETCDSWTKSAIQNPKFVPQCTG